MYPSYNLDKLARQKEELENLIKSYQQPSRDMIEWRILNENEEVDNLYVSTKTLFISDDMMVLKGVDGKTEKWEIKKVYPIDKKDRKINELEEKIKELEMKLNESTESNGSTRERVESTTDDDGDVESESKTSGESVPREE